MESIVTLEHLGSLLLLVLLQAVLGIDNLLYISIASKEAPQDKQNRVRTIGISWAIILRIVLLFLLIKLIALFQEPWIVIKENAIVTGTFNFHSLIILLGGVFIMYTAVKEIWHMMHLPAGTAKQGKGKSMNQIIFMMILMNLVFSFDSILGAMALTDEFWVMAVAIVIGGLLMIWLSGHVTEFLKRNRMYEVLGLFILLIVGIMLLSEGGHLAHLHLFGNPVTPMSKTTFYFIIAVLVVIDIVQNRYQKNLDRNRETH
ncbi:MAG: tellurium resistance protein TerC [Flavobacteriaceae bacterium]|jgi:predicted tellurium resistance membrane protein TerC|nr:tellurium resistance protein TerC [Flavobacteriaceae bacterium]